jgi:WD40 repeat protein
MLTRRKTSAFAPENTMLVSLGRIICLLGFCLVCVPVWGEETTVATLKEHKGWVAGVAFSPDSKQLATASADRTVRTWACHSGRALEELKGHPSSVQAR